jgi:RHS repeat-associated protein
VWAELSSTNVVQYRYLNGGGPTQAFARIDVIGASRAWLLADQLGSIRDVADTTQVNDHVEYKPFGDIASESNVNNGVPIMFTGLYEDRISLLILAWWRPGNTQIGQWNSEDPDMFRAGDANLRRYVGNSPTSSVDPSGLLKVAGIYIITHPTKDNSDFAALDAKYNSLVPPGFFEASRNPFTDAGNAWAKILSAQAGGVQFLDRASGNPWNWSPFKDYAPLDLVSKDNKTRLIGGRFSLVMDLDETTSCLKKVTVMESADQFYLVRRSWIKFPKESYMNRANIDDAPVDLTTWFVFRPYSNLSIGPAGRNNFRTLFMMDSPSFSFVREDPCASSWSLQTSDESARIGEFSLAFGGVGDQNAGASGYPMSLASTSVRRLFCRPGASCREIHVFLCPQVPRWPVHGGRLPRCSGACASQFF